jgi:hypothetical protein
MSHRSVRALPCDKPEKNDKKMNEAIARLFKQFPPGHAATR